MAYLYIIDSLEGFMKYNKSSVLNLMASTPKGVKRASLLKNEDLRNVVLSSGANVTIYTGEVKSDGDNVVEALSNVHVGLIQRKNRHGNFDGLGALGGLAERTDAAEFEALSLVEKLELVTKKDDVILLDGAAVLIDDIDIIRQNNVQREMQEELANLNIANIKINPQDMELISMPKVKDDNYMINIWDGQGECYAISPYCHIYHDKQGIVDSIIENAKEEIGGEVAEYKKIALIDALGAYGQKGVKYCLEDGRNAVKDYRYPHEYLACWGLASKLLKADEAKMVQLALAVQRRNSHHVSFAKIAEVTSQTMDDVAEVLNVRPEVLNKMEECMHNAYKSSRCIKEYTNIVNRR